MRRINTKRRHKRADKVIAFIENLTIPSGLGAGSKFKLRRFQEKFIRAIYTPHVKEDRQWRRVVRKAVLSIARKNGKTALIAALVLVHLVGPESVPNGELYSAANDREQATIIFKFARQMIELDRELADMVMVVPSTKTIISRLDGSVYRAISAEAGTKHGLNPTFVVFDELAQSKNRDLYDVLDTSFGARAEPLFAVISTQSNDPEHIFSKLIDDGLNAQRPETICHLYAVPDDADIFDPEVWMLANPALGDFRSMADFKALAERARRMPAEEPKFRNLFLNQRVAPYSTLVSRAAWFACIGPVDLVDGEEVYGGLDLSARNDLTALVLVSNADPSRVKPLFWKPEELLDEHSNRDFGHNTRRYQEWHKEGWLDVSPGRSIDLAVVAMRIAQLSERYRIRGIAFDRWRVEELLKEFDRIGFQTYRDKAKGEREKPGYGLRMVDWGQGFYDMGPAVDALLGAIDERKLVHPSSPVLNWNLANAVASMDAAGNRKVDKEKAKFRVDGAVALVMAVGLKARDRLNEVPLDIRAMVA